MLANQRALGSGKFLEASSNTNTQSLPRPTEEGTNSLLPEFSNTPSEIAYPSLGLNHQPRSLSALSLEVLIVVFLP